MALVARLIDRGHPARSELALDAVAPAEGLRQTWVQMHLEGSVRGILPSKTDRGGRGVNGYCGSHRLAGEELGALIPPVAIDRTCRGLPAFDLLEALEESSHCAFDRRQPGDVRRDHHAPVVPQR